MIEERISSCNSACISTRERFTARSRTWSTRTPTGTTQLESRRAVLEACEQTMERLASDPLYFAKPDRALFQDIRRYFPITAQAEVAWAVGRASTRR